MPFPTKKNTESQQTHTTCVFYVAGVYQVKPRAAFLGDGSQLDHLLKIHLLGSSFQTRFGAHQSVTREKPSDRKLVKMFWHHRRNL